jgi:hypothetical protein
VLAAKRTGATTDEPVSPPRVYKRLLDVFEPTRETVVELMSLDLPVGVHIEMKPFGNGCLQYLSN